MSLFDGTVGFGTAALLALCLLIALGFEFVNGFHDTANAVATVIYTKSLQPWTAVLWSGLMNFLGVLLGGSAVAFGIVHLLPVDLLINIGKSAGLLMVLSLLLSAILWNFGTWYFGLPSSSSHALIGSILGVGLASSFFSGSGVGSGVNWGQAQKVGLSLLISPLLGFFCAALLLLLCRALIKKPALYQEPHGDAPPPFWIRCVLFLTCTGVSYFHGSNDGQKGVGLIMLILIGILPAQYALNSNFDAAKVNQTVAAVRQLEVTVQAISARAGDAALTETQAKLAGIRTALTDLPSLRALSAEQRTGIRADILRVDDSLGKLLKADASLLTAEEKKAITEGQKQMKATVDFVVPWVVVAVACALGLGTTVGWKRIVVTVGEKIGKTHLTYAQGASAELVAMSMIALGDMYGLPVSTTHVLSSGIAGTMAANRSGIQGKTIRNIALAWVLTLPVTMLLSATLFSLTARSAMADIGDKARVTPQTERIPRKLE